MVVLGARYEAARATVNRKRPIGSGANAMSGHAMPCETGPGSQIIARYSVIVPA